uniref:Lipase n=1 Tax=Plectus sambesii TaxID=2011161 RepID=A0A914WPK3_9BILA
MASLVAVFCVALAFGQAWAVNDPEEHLDTIGIIQHWGYPAERHQVTTDDGYILELHRVPYGKGSSPGGNRPVVFLQHGLECSSSNWVTNLPSESAAYIFADAGFDVWMGNFRGNTYSQKHVSLSPSSHDFWKFSWDEMAKHDLPAMINYVLAQTGQSQLHYMGHSMGTMTAFAQFSADPVLRAKIKNFFGLGPVATIGHCQGFITHIAKFLPQLEYLIHLIGEDQFLPSNWFIKLVADVICAAIPDKNHLCDNVLFLIAGPESNQFNDTRVAVYVSHTPADTSTQNMIHFGQMVLSNKYQQYDYGSTSKNLEHYGTKTPPEYSVKDFHIPTYLYWGDEDWLADPTDVAQTLLPNLPNIVQSNEMKGWNHLDFIWGLNAADQIYHPVVEIMKAS